MNQETIELLKNLQEQKWEPEVLKHKLQLLLKEQEKTAYHKIPSRF